MSRRYDQVARRYVAWMRRRALVIIAAHIALVAGAVYLIANYLPIQADFSYLLPQDAPAVRDLRRLEGRVKPGDFVLALVEAPDPATRAAATKELAEGLRELPRDLVERIEEDDTEVRAFFTRHQGFFPTVEELEHARDGLRERMRIATRNANPLFIDLEPPDPKAEALAKAKVDEMRAKRRDAEAKIPRAVSHDGKLAMVQIRTPFRTTDAGRGQRLLAALEAIRAPIVAKYPDVKIGFTGSVVNAVAEHGAIFNGMVMSSVITMLLVGLLLSLYFRSATLLVLLVGTLVMATVISFGMAALTVGRLNAATAFLGAIIAGNGVNYGILLIARYLEERRRHEVDEALAIAIVGTVRPTAVAALGASIAYGSLAATSFRGFADFAIIGAIGMMVCWVTTYLLLPAVMLRFGRGTRVYAGDPVVGSTLVAVLGFRRSGVVCVVATVLALAAGVIVYRYVAADPFEYDIKNLRSEGDDAVVAREWMQKSDREFGRGITTRTYVAADRADQVPKIIAALQAHDRDVPDPHKTFGSINSILDVVPTDQEKKVPILDEIRKLLDDPKLDALPEPERSELRALRPPDKLVPFTHATLPTAIRERLTENDPTKVGLLISIRPAPQLDEWNGHDLIRFANAVRKIELPGGETVTTSGTSVIFADIVDSIEKDGPIVTGVASIGLVVMVLLLVGPNRRAAAVLVGTASGTLLMVAVCALIDLKVNFLDFVALPITLGLGIDYAINVAHRHDHEEVPDPITTLRTSGSAVFVCSLTTIIGYGSLLVSDNLAICGFGTASLIGEICCVFTALVLVPAILAVGRGPRAQHRTQAAA